MINSEKLLTFSSFILFSLDRAHKQRSTELIKNKPKPDSSVSISFYPLIHWYPAHEQLSFLKNVSHYCLGFLKSHKFIFAAAECLLTKETKENDWIPLQKMYNVAQSQFLPFTHTHWENTSFIQYDPSYLYITNFCNTLNWAVERPLRRSQIVFHFLTYTNISFRT